MHCLNPLGARNISPSGLYLQRKTLAQAKADFGSADNRA